MKDLGFALRRVQLGDGVVFFNDYYGRQWIELRPRWFFRPRARVYLRVDEIQRVMSALRDRSRSRGRDKSGAR